MAQPINRHYPGTPGTPLYVGVAPPGAVLTTRTIQNTSASAQASGFVSPMFGVPLVQGHVPAGQYPEFRLGDTKVAATIYNTASWADGSMSMCGALVRVPSGVTGSGSLSLSVCTGGTAPIASSRTLAEVVAGSDIKIEFTGTANLTGTWTASLNDAIANDANIALIGDGPAGKVYIIGGHFKQSGAAHGQLYCEHSVAILENEAGGLLGIRYLGVFGQQFGDVASPAPIYREGTIVLKNGATTVRTLQGVNAMFDGEAAPGGAVTTTVRIPHWSQHYTSGPGADWDYFPCGGTGAADCTVRVIPDTAYVQRTMLVPAYGTAIAVTDVASADYYINSKGNHKQYQMGGPGERNEIGIMPSWCAKYWINPSAANERAVRVNAACGLGYLATTVPVATKKPPATYAGPWTGLGETKENWSLITGSGIVYAFENGHVWQTDVAHRPSPIYSAYLMTGEPHLLRALQGHACGHAMMSNSGYINWYAARPLTGGAMNETTNGYKNLRVDGTGEIYDAGGLLMRDGGIRQGAWAFRDIAAAYAMSPSGHVDGDYKGYFNHVLTQAFRGFNAYMAAQPSGYQADGMFAYGTRQTAGGDGIFMVNYFDMMLCFASAVTQNAQAITARQYLGRRFNAIASRYNVGHLGAYDCLVWDDVDVAENFGEVVWGMKGPAGTLTFSTASNNVTLSAVNGALANWTPTNGDVFAFVTTGTNPSTRPYEEMVDYKRFYAVQCSGKTFKLSTTPGGSPLTVVRNFSMPGGYYANIQDRTNGFMVDLVSTRGEEYIAASTGCMNYHALLGDDVSVAATPLRSSLTYFGINFAADPKFAYQPALPT